MITRKRLLKIWGLKDVDPAVRSLAKQVNTMVPTMGPAARKLLAAFQSAHKLHPTGTWNGKTLDALLGYSITKKYQIGQTWHALTHGGVRSVSSIKNIVLHDMEFAGNNADEVLGQISEGASYRASPHFGVDDDSIQQYLPINIVGWQALGDNQTTIGIEQAGYASWPTAQWMSHMGTLDRTAWLLAQLYKQTRIPLFFVDAADLKAGRHGVTTHWEVSKAFAPGGHTDPGSNYPMSTVLARAREYAGVAVIS